MFTIGIDSAPVYLRAAMHLTEYFINGQQVLFDENYFQQYIHSFVSNFITLPTSWTETIMEKYRGSHLFQ